MPGWLDRRPPDGLGELRRLDPSAALTRLNSKTRKRSRVRQHKDDTRPRAGLPRPRCRRQPTCAGLSPLLGRHRTDVGPRHPRSGGTSPLRRTRPSRLGRVGQESRQPRSAYPGRRRRRDHCLAGAIAIHFGRTVDGWKDRPDIGSPPAERAEGTSCWSRLHLPCLSLRPRSSARPCSKAIRAPPVSSSLSRS